MHIRTLTVQKPGKANALDGLNVFTLILGTVAELIGMLDNIKSFFGVS